MKLSDGDLETLTRIGEQAAREAGALINQYTNKSFDIEFKDGGDSLAAQVVTDLDRQCEAVILKRLAPTFQSFDIAVLSEETEDDKQRLSKDYFWCVDPLDGTLAFTESKPGYAVSIALVSREGKPLIGIIYDPVNDTLYSATRDQGAKRNNVIWQWKPNTPYDSFTLPCDRSLETRETYSVFLQQLEHWSESEGYNSVNKIHHAGAVMNACWALENTPAAYFKPPKAQRGGGSVWDFAATACLYQELGAWVSDFKGAELSLNPIGSTFMNHCGVLFATNKAMAEAIVNLWQESVQLK